MRIVADVWSVLGVCHADVSFVVHGMPADSIVCIVGIELMKANGRKRITMTKKTVDAKQLTRMMRRNVERYVEACKCAGPGMQNEQWDAYDRIQVLLKAIEDRGGVYEIK